MKMRSDHKIKKIYKLLLPPLVLVLTGCVSDSSTSALTSTDIQTKLDTHEQRHVASKCNSADRLRNSNLASEALNSKYTALESNSAALEPDKKSKIETNLQAQATQLQTLDSNLSGQCISWSKCEYQASTSKQSCATEKHKYREADKRMVKFYKQISSIKVN